LLHILDAVKAAGKPVVGHNCFYDLAFLFANLEAVSGDWDTFCTTVTNSFPVRKC
jgi:CAF1 family ribonuclease